MKKIICIILSLIALVPVSFAAYNSHKHTNINVIVHNNYIEKMPEFTWKSTNHFDGRHLPAETWGYKKWKKIKLDIYKANGNRKKLCEVRYRSKGGCGKGKVTTLVIYDIRNKKGGKNCMTHRHCIKRGDFKKWLEDNTYFVEYDGPHTSYTLAGVGEKIQKLNRAEGRKNAFKRRQEGLEKKKKALMKKVEVAEKDIKDLAHKKVEPRIKAIKVSDIIDEDKDTYKAVFTFLKPEIKKIKPLLAEAENLLQEARILVRDVDSFLKEKKRLLQSKDVKNISKLAKKSRDLKKGLKEIEEKSADIKKEKAKLEKELKKIHIFQEVSEGHISSLAELDESLLKKMHKAIFSNLHKVFNERKDLEYIYKFVKNRFDKLGSSKAKMEYLTDSKRMKRDIRKKLIDLAKKNHVDEKDIGKKFITKVQKKSTANGKIPDNITIDKAVYVGAHNPHTYGWVYSQQGETINKLFNDYKVRFLKVAVHFYDGKLSLCHEQNGKANCVLTVVQRLGKEPVELKLLLKEIKHFVKKNPKEVVLIKLESLIYGKNNGNVSNGTQNINDSKAKAILNKVISDTVGKYVYKIKGEFPTFGELRKKHKTVVVFDQNYNGKGSKYISNFKKYILQTHWDDGKRSSCGLANSRKSTQGLMELNINYESSVKIAGELFNKRAPNYNFKQINDADAIKKRVNNCKEHIKPNGYETKMGIILSSDYVHLGDLKKEAKKYNKHLSDKK